MNRSRSRNHRGRFLSNRTRKAKNTSAINIRIEDPTQFQRIFRKGGMKIVIAVSDDTCPHCVKYKPTWNTLAKTEGRNVPMISMPSSVYNQTELAKQKEVKGVPTVLYVSPNGTVNEVEDIRDEAKMTSLLKSNVGAAGSNSGSNTNSARANSGSNTNSVAPAIPTNIPIMEPEDMPAANEPAANEPAANKPAANEPAANKPAANEPTALQIPGLTDALPELPTIPVSQVNRSGNGSNMTSSGNRPSSNIVPTNAVKPVLPGVTTQPNPLTPLPGSPVSSEKQVGGYSGNILQTGGNPWSAFMMAAKQAAPAAVLLGAYSMMPRSSGLGRPRSRSRKSKSRRQRE